MVIEPEGWLTINTNAMKIKFKTRLEAIDWMAANAENEGQFEVMREQLQFNQIYTGSLFIDLDKVKGEVVMFDRKDT